MYLYCTYIANSKNNETGAVSIGHHERRRVHSTRSKSCLSMVCNMRIVPSFSVITWRIILSPRWSTTLHYDFIKRTRQRSSSILLLFSKSARKMLEECHHHSTIPNTTLYPSRMVLAIPTIHQILRGSFYRRNWHSKHRMHSVIISSLLNDPVRWLPFL